MKDFRWRQPLWAFQITQTLNQQLKGLNRPYIVIVMITACNHCFIICFYPRTVHFYYIDITLAQSFDTSDNRLLLIVMLNVYHHVYHEYITLYISKMHGCKGKIFAIFTHPLVILNITLSYNMPFKDMGYSTWLILCNVTF